MATVDSVQDCVSVDLVGDIIIARLRGEVSIEMLNERHARVQQIRREKNCTRLLFDDSEMNAMPYAALKTQQGLNTELSALGFQVAIVVPDSELAYLARIQFGELPHRVFYGDLVEATAWLTQTKVTAAA
jgi:hypothetical protein